MVMPPKNGVAVWLNVRGYNDFMQNAAQYFGRFQTARGGFNTLPPLARCIVAIFALPGIALLVLSIALALCSIFVLLLLTVPVYRVLRAVFGGRQPITDVQMPENPVVFSLFGQALGADSNESPGRRQVEAKVTDAE
jgi:hypothetical protein